jgi:hypothetical protein
MVYVKWGIRVLILLMVGAFLHYTLPQHDVARITDTYSRISPIKYPMFWSNEAAGGATARGRDVFMIETFRTNDKPMIYRNEDTDWGWPPYFKFDTANLQADASNLVSTSADPQWVMVRHYGWRSEFLSIYPNATRIWAVDGPDARIIPWFNIIFLTILAALYWGIRVRWIRFRENRIKPVYDEWTDGWG